MNNWTEQFDIVYKIYCSFAIEKGERASKLGMAKFLGVTQGKMQRWEAGAQPAAVDCALISDKLGIDLRWLITGEGEPLNSVEPVIGSGRSQVEMNMELLYEIVESLDEILKELGKTLTPGQKAAAVCKLYEYLNEMDEETVQKPATILRFIKQAIA